LAKKHEEAPEGVDHLSADYVDAAIAVRQNRWSEVVRLLAPSAYAGLFIEVMATRWMVADAYEHLGKPDSAIVYYELIAEPRRAFTPQRFLRGWYYPFAVRRLAILYGEKGNAKKSREYWLKFVKTFEQADREFQPLVAEARAALAEIGTS